MLQRTISASYTAFSTSSGTEVPGPQRAPKVWPVPSTRCTQATAQAAPAGAGSRKAVTRNAWSRASSASAGGSTARTRRGAPSVSPNQLLRTRSRSRTSQAACRAAASGSGCEATPVEPVLGRRSQPGGGRCWRNAAPAATSTGSPRCVRPRTQSRRPSGRSSGASTRTPAPASSWRVPTVPAGVPAAASASRPARTLPSRSSSSPRAPSTTRSRSCPAALPTSTDAPPAALVPSKAADRAATRAIRTPGCAGHGVKTCGVHAVMRRTGG